jgi:hypothetical protein
MATTKTKAKKKGGTAYRRGLVRYKDAPPKVQEAHRAWHDELERIENIRRIASNTVESKVFHVEKDQRDHVNAAIAQARLFVDTLDATVPPPNYDGPSPLEAWRRQQVKKTAKAKARPRKAVKKTRGPAAPIA